MIDSGCCAADAAGWSATRPLRATVQWSYQLLPEAERVLFDRLSVFAGGFDLAAAEAVCADDRVDRLDVAGDLAALVDKSMVVADRAGNHARYRLLETLRQFGEERLDETAQAGELRDRHLRHYLGVAHDARRHYEGRAQAAGAATFRAEWANIRAAIQWAITQEDQATATGLLDALFFFAYLEERYELGDWASQALTARLATPTAYGIAAAFAAMRGDYDHALSLTETGLAAAKSPTEPETWACWMAAGGAHWYLGRREQAWAAWKTMLQTIDPVREPFRGLRDRRLQHGHGRHRAPIPTRPKNSWPTPNGSPHHSTTPRWTPSSPTPRAPLHERKVTTNQRATTTSGPSPSPSAAATSSCRASCRCPRRSWP